MAEERKVYRVDFYCPGREDRFDYSLVYASSKDEARKLFRVKHPIPCEKTSTPRAIFIHAITELDDDKCWKWVDQFVIHVLEFIDGQMLTYYAGSIAAAVKLIHEKHPQALHAGIVGMGLHDYDVEVIY